MITQKSLNAIGLILKAAVREAGEMEKDGKIISWSEAFQITILPLEDESGKIRKFVVDPLHVDKISQQLDSVHWACLVELELKNRQVVAVQIHDDILSNYYDR